jgi:hypothetical protein
MPAYPFIAVFIAQYFLNIATYRTTVVRVFAGVMTFLMGIIAVFAMTAMIAGEAQLETIARLFTSSPSALRDVTAVIGAFARPGIVTSLILLFSAGVFGILVYQFRRRIQLKILYASVAAVFALNLCIDGIIMRGVHDAGSASAFATEMDYIKGEDLYVMNDLNEYRNLYCLNFYLGNRFLNFEKTLPEKGFFLAAESDMPKVLDKYGSRYSFLLTVKSPQPLGDIRGNACCYFFFRRAQPVPRL